MIEEPENEENGEKDDDDPREVLEAWIAEQDDKVQAMFKEGTDGLLTALKKEREAAKEAARLEKELEEANKKLDAHKTDEEKELDVRQAKIDELTESFTKAEEAALTAVNDLVKERIKYAVTVEALKMGFEDPDDAQALLPEDSGVKYNKKKDEVEGVEEALEALVEAKPYLLGSVEVGTPRTVRKKKLSSDDKKAPVEVKF